ncbi:NAD(P)H-quinone oxidoreductase [Massilia rhizosphaerae]|uniref:NAD(P)H-quinone oxidoreductase n=1 Tax=Massilia rhizosphaerae TaxID=2784389 RepID=UPI0018DC56E7|nr:NAD(P)H-quinone oxidoreductase [Massilia rhizosphaerae]
MRAIEIVQPGGPEVLQPCERPVPTLKPGEILIRVHAAGVNRPDVFQRLGQYPVPPGASDLPGLEVAGEIVDGDLAGSGFAKGDLVCALVQGGGYAEYCAAPLAQCLPVPRGLSPLEAAALPETFFTVWSNVFQRAALADGETLLVQGGSSGIGTTAIQLARALGHRVFATAGSPDKCRACEDLGAERAIDYKTEDFVPVVKEATNGKGVDVVLDMVGGDYVAREMSCLADDGRIVIIALLGGARANVDLGQVLRRRLTVTGSTLRPRPVAFKEKIARELRERVWPLLEAGRIKPVIHQTFPLEQAAAAHALMESSAHVGKIMLNVSGHREQE